MSSASLWLWLQYFALSSELWVLLSATWLYQRINQETQPFYFFFFYVVLEESFETILAMGYGIHNLWWMNIYQLTETVFFTWIFNSWLLGRKGRWWYFVMWLIFGSYWIYSTFYLHSIFKMNAFARTVECIMVSVYAAVILIRLSKRLDIPLFQNPRFWIASGAMLYFSHSVLVFAIFQVIANNDYVLSLIQPVWNVHSIINIFSNLLYSIAFMCPKKPFAFPLRK